MNKALDELFIYPKEWVDEEARSIVSVVRQWADKEVLAHRLKYREHYSEQFSKKRKTLNLTIGLQRLILPADQGGHGWNNPENATGLLAVLSEIGRADASIGVMAAVQFSILAVALMTPNLDKALTEVLAPIYGADQLKTSAIVVPSFGTPDQKTPLFFGRSITAKLEPADDGYFVSGSPLRPFGGGAIADIFCVVCADQNGKACVAFIPAEEKGITRGRPLLETGLNACENTDISFNRVKILKSHVITGNGAVQALFAWLNLLLGGASLGASMNFFEILSDWADTRTIKGGSIMKENPLCASVLAEVAEEIAVSRLMLFDLAHILAKPENWGNAGSSRVYTYAQMIGSRTQQSALKALNKGMELMGSAGYAKEWHVEKHWRDIKTIQSYLCGVGAEVPVKMDTARYFFDCKEI
jgi:alkylation response protein AidB-like acyl-CoA dehydrogenase